VDEFPDGFLPPSDAQFDSSATQVSAEGVKAGLFAGLKKTGRDVTK
jgi:hypothetical protein